MTKLSVNINKIATLRNARGGNNPDLLKVASDIQSFGANGITIHPRPDERHIKYVDAINLRGVVYTELNIEGNPVDKFIESHRLSNYPARGTDVSVVLDLMIHDIDIVLSIVKSKVKYISAERFSTLNFLL